MKYPSCMRWFVAAALASSFAGCGGDAPAPVPPPPPQKVAAPSPKAPPAAVANAAQPGGEAPSSACVYDPAGRRDPFEPLVLIKKPAVQSDLPQTPLQTFEVGQLRLIGVVVGKGAPRAMVMAPDEKAYILQKGVLVGKNNGKVKDIRTDVVVVEEQYVDFSGEVRSGTQEIRLPKREGVL